MVHFTRSLIGAAALFAVSSAAPMPRPEDSAIGAEIPVSAPDGTPTSDPVPSATVGSYHAMGDSSSGSSYGGSKGSYGDSKGSYGDSKGSYGGSKGDSWSSSQGSYWSSSAEKPSYTQESQMSSETMMSESTSTSSAVYSQMTYGSGSSSWGGSGYDDCVQQCVASFGKPSMTWTPSATQSSSGGGGGGVTHTIIVAPTQGVLRYIPFSTNASVGDVLSFVWGAGPHTVTKGSALETCNQSQDAASFASGRQNKSFIFNQVVNDTKPTWYFCGVPGHCQKGMFGGVNIGQPDPTGNDAFNGSSGGSSSYMPLNSMISNLTTMNPDMTALWKYTKNQTSGNAYANGWGMSTNMAGMDSNAMMQTAENVMYMQTLIAANPQAVKDGKFAVTDANSLKIPQDLQQALASTSGNTAGAAGAAAGSTPSASSGASSAVAAAPAPTDTANGAGSLASSSVVVGLVAVVATFFAL